MYRFFHMWLMDQCTVHNAQPTQLIHTNLCNVNCVKFCHSVIDTPRGKGCFEVKKLLAFRS